MSHCKLPVGLDHHQPGSAAFTRRAPSPPRKQRQTEPASGVTGLAWQLPPPFAAARQNG